MARFEANVAKCAGVVYRIKRAFDGEWFGEYPALPHIDYCDYLE